MLLHRLYSNKSTFREIKFNTKGITIILAERVTSKKGASSNGVGKSLALYLVSYCLGSQKNSAFEKHLASWSFSLEFSIQGQKHIATRSTDNQTNIELDGNPISVRHFRKWLQNETFKHHIQSIPTISFRLAISQFLRNGKGAYNTFNSPSIYKNSFQDLLRFAFFVGLDMWLVTQKEVLRTSEQQTSKEKKALEENKTIKSFFIGADDYLDVSELSQKEEAIQKQINDLDNHVDYAQLNSDSAKLQYKIKSLSNQQNLLKESLKNIDASIGMAEVNISNSIESLYKNVTSIFQNEIKKNLNDLFEFNRIISNNRIQRLKKAKKQLLIDIELLGEKITNQTKAFEEIQDKILEEGILKNLIIEFEDIIEKKEKISRQKDYVDLLHEYSTQLETIKSQQLKDNEKADAYAHNEMKDCKNIFEKQFSKYIKAFYPDSLPELIIQNNSGDNTTRFDYDIKVASDASYGINEAKIFCYDFACLTLAINHRIKFLFHDSSLFSEIDPLQKGVLLQLAEHEAIKNDLQYIASFNKDQIDSIQNELQPDVFDKLIKQNIVITLGEKTSQKLLGVEVPGLRYDRKKDLESENYPEEELAEN